jgi:hypothetical protein
MSDRLDDDAVEAVRKVKAAVAEAQDELTAAGLGVTKVELVLETALTLAGGGGFKIKIIDIEAHHTRATTQTLTLDLTPVAEPVEALGPSLAEELRQAIVAIGAATQEAAATQPRFKLEEAAVALQVGITNDGKIAPGATPPRRGSCARGVGALPGGPLPEPSTAIRRPSLVASTG